MRHMTIRMPAATNEISKLDTYHGRTFFFFCKSYWIELQSESCHSGRDTNVTKFKRKTLRNSLARPHWGTKPGKKVKRRPIRTFVISNNEMSRFHQQLHIHVMNGECNIAESEKRTRKHRHKSRIKRTSFNVPAKCEWKSFIWSRPKTEINAEMMLLPQSVRKTTSRWRRRRQRWWEIIESHLKEFCGAHYIILWNKFKSYPKQSAEQ